MPKDVTAADISNALSNLSVRRRTPVNTYRLQFHRGFGFKDATSLIPYLARLGITDCYSSPFLKARPGSMHGYDICDHNKLNPELGTAEDYERFIRTLHEHRMGHILDFVPNHMGVDAETNPWWHDVLENGQGSPFAHYFDIHWHPIKPELRGKVLLPILGGPYGEVLERGEIQLEFHDGVFSVTYFDQRLPIDPKQYSRILLYDLESLKKELRESDPALREYLSILTAFGNLPANTETAPERIAERRREKAVAQERLSRLIHSVPKIPEHIRRIVTLYNGQVGQPDSFDELHNLLELQAYRLAYWKTAFHEINYRRFFDINALAGIRVEKPEIFSVVHRLVMRHIAEGKITGLRIDHPDGLYDPAGYFESLQDMFLREYTKYALHLNTEDWNPEYTDAVRDWRTNERKKDPKGLGARPLYIVAEKILSKGEVLDAHWAIDGTSGYDFLNHVNGLFVDPASSTRMEEVYTRFTDKDIPFDIVAYECKKLIMSTSLASELNVLAYSLHQIAEGDRRSRDFTLDSLRDALKEVIACFPVYRTYINTSRGGATDRDIIERAIMDAKGRNPALETSIFDFIQSVLTPNNADKVSGEEFRRQLAFTLKFQQYTGPVQAKGLEDTAFYRYNVLLSLNEVGGNPTRFGTQPEDFHIANTHLQAEWPYAMSATATHDTKRGEDARVRLSVLSEMPDAWEQEVNRWSELTQSARTQLPTTPSPDRNDEYLFYQTLVGAWGGEMTRDQRRDLCKRLQDYMLKAVKEAKLHTSWVSPNEAYEKGILNFVEQVMVGDVSEAFFASFIPFNQRVSRLGMLNSLAQVVLKLTSPGVPDFYQGTELWDLSLVDPDNRRPVDYTTRINLFRRMEPWINHAISYVDPVLQGARKRVLVATGYNAPDLTGQRSASFNMNHLLMNWKEGAIKMFITACGLRLRQRYPDLFLQGDYTPLSVIGEKANNIVAFARRHGDHAILAIVPRLVSNLASSRDAFPMGKESWHDTRIVLPPRVASTQWLNLFTQTEIYSNAALDNSLNVSDLLASCPVGLFATSYL